MPPIGLIALQGIGVVVFVLIAWVLTQRRMGFPWSAIGWGALSFPLSQIARLAVITPLNVLWAQILSPGAAATATVATMLISSGLFEETTRWVVLRFWAKNVRQWRDGVGFGLGHGGIEAILIIAGTALTNAVLMMNSDAIVESVAKSGDPAAAGAIGQQIDTLKQLTFTDIGLSWYERVLAVVAHVAFTLIVLRAVRERRWQLWLLAVVAHIAFNAVVVVVGAPAGALAVYAIMTVVAAVALWAVAFGPLSRRAVEGAGARAR